jgi:hypothetical protein
MPREEELHDEQVLGYSRWIEREHERRFGAQYRATDGARIGIGITVQWKRTAGGRSFPWPVVPLS